MIRQILTLVELASGKPADIAAPLMLDQTSLARARSLLPDGPRYIALAPGAGGRHKCWPLDRYRALAEHLKGKGEIPVFILGPGEREWIDQCRAVAGAKLPLQGHGYPSTPELTIALAQRCSRWPLAAIVYTDISKDGMLEGPNLDALDEMARAVSVPVIASGGVTTLDDIRRLAALRLAGCIIGRALYEGRLNLQEAIRVGVGVRGQGSGVREPEDSASSLTPDP